ncbi:MAG: hypothetical protein HUU26_05675, partial [Gemmatimonadaceae bacterium]|nr:hypothetical protein [Gemmatimonadaceae bacterium]
MPFLAAALGAVVLALLLAGRAGAGRIGALGALVLGLALMAGLREHWHVERLRNDWADYSQRVALDGTTTLQEALEGEVRALDDIATAAMRAPSEATAAFRHLASLGPYPGHRGVVLVGPAGPIAWAGFHRAPPAAIGDAPSVLWTPFYVVVRRVVRRDDRAAVAEAVVHAHPPAD